MNALFYSAYAAPVDYYKNVAKATTIYIEAQEHFLKQTFRNRCVIASANGPLKLSIPISGSKNNTAMADIKICYKNNWQLQHLRTFVAAYNSSPFFEFYVPELQNIFNQKPENLIEWNMLLHQQIMKWLKLNTPTRLTESYQKEYSNGIDFRTLEPINNHTNYHQVFENKFGFTPNLSILDLLFNCGNQSVNILLTSK